MSALDIAAKAASPRTADNGTLPGNADMSARHPSHIAAGRFARGLRYALLLAAVLLLSGCLLGGDKNVSLYSPQLQVQPKSDWPSVAWPLVVARPLCSDALDSDHIAVRPQAQTMQVYAGALWSDPVPDLFQSALVRAFEDSGKIVAVGRQSTGMRGDFVLLTDIRQFEAVYTDAGAPPTVTLSVQAKLLAQPQTRVLAMRRFDIRVPAADKEVPAVVAAFGAAMTQLNEEIIGWTLATGQANTQPASPAK